MFSRRWLRFVSLTVVLWLAAPALAQTVVDADWLNAEVMRLYRKGSYAEAVSIAERVLAIREKKRWALTIPTSVNMPRSLARPTKRAPVIRPRQ